MDNNINTTKRIARPARSVVFLVAVGFWVLGVNAQAFAAERGDGDGIYGNTEQECRSSGGTWTETLDGGTSCCTSDIDLGQTCTDCDANGNCEVCNQDSPGNDVLLCHSVRADVGSEPQAIDPGLPPLPPASADPAPLPGPVTSGAVQVTPAPSTAETPAVVTAAKPRAWSFAGAGAIRRVAEIGKWLA